MSKPEAAFRYRRPVVPLHFPVEERVPESRRHYELRTLLFAILRFAYGHEATVGSDQFVYWNAANPRQCLSPDVFVRFGEPDHTFDSWQTWVSGAPQLAVEIVSRSDKDEPGWEVKLGRYHELGVTEVVRYDADAKEGERMRVFDRIDGDVIERTLESEVASSRVLPGMTWILAPGAGYPAALRVRKADGSLLLSNEELLAEEARSLQATKDALASEKDALVSEKDALAKQRDEMARRVAELEAELSRRR